jgi:hypothetical protein
MTSKAYKIVIAFLLMAVMVGGVMYLDPMGSPATSEPESSDAYAERPGHLQLNGLHLNGLKYNGLAYNSLELNSIELNALTMNSLQLNGVTINGVTINGVTINGVTINGVVMNGFPLQGLVNPKGLSERLEMVARNKDGMELLRVFTACALPEGEALEVSNGEEILRYQGSLGLAPEWRTSSLSEPSQRWMSACLLSHVNAMGAHVQISVRGDRPSLEPTDQEAKEYRIEEGAFYGNLFSEQPYAASCIGHHEPGSPAMSNRLCASEVIGSETVCGIVSAGQCTEVCDVKSQGDQQVYTNCRLGDHSVTSEVITVFLSDSTAEKANAFTHEAYVSNE